MQNLVIFFFLFFSFTIYGQSNEVFGRIHTNEHPLYSVKVSIDGQNKGAYTNQEGEFSIKGLNPGKYLLKFYYLGKQQDSLLIFLGGQQDRYEVNFNLKVPVQEVQEMVVSGTLKAVGKLDSPVAIEVYNTCFFQSNPAPSIFESLSNVNGVRPQLNCNICNTGDIHINGLEGPYTMVLIDGMPLVSGLSTVYGLSGIPQSLIDRVEVVKGPASTLYGSEAVGGLINIITKSPDKAPLFSAEHYTTSWLETNTDLGLKYKVNPKLSGLMGIHYFNYQNPIDNNGDGFTDMTLQDQISIFNKFSWKRKDNRLFYLAGRYVYEDRWGGQMNWTPQFRGGDSLYGESIYTSRWETFGTYQLPIKERVMVQFSANGHSQNSFYGTTPFFAEQRVLFGQLLWNKVAGRNDWLVGASYRHTYYDDNTTATAKVDTLTISGNSPSVIQLPGIFLQNDIHLNENNRLLLGLRYDQNNLHGAIFTPRMNYKWTSQNKRNILRLSLGNGYRVANVFTEDHAALTGARKVIFEDKLNPETSYNSNLNYVKQVRTKKNHVLTFDATLFYTYFENKILPDYDTDPNLIIYRNLSGYAESKGISLNLDFTFGKNFTVNAGTTVMEVTVIENGQRKIQTLTERASGVWRIHYNIEKWELAFDYTGNLYGPMRLPLLGPLDDRSPYSPIFSIQNIQVTKKIKKQWELFGGIKNLLNFTPPANSIARAQDPFDKKVHFDNNGQVLPTAENPNALTFDPSYVFSSNQGIRFFLGFRVAIK